MGAAGAFAKLNERQREAAQAPANPLLIIAGAGTGKTNTLAHRVAHLVLAGVAPERILLLTFTRRAALEMTRRAARIVAEAHGGVRLPWSGTFHSVANRVIRRHCAAVGLAESFSVLDRGDAADLMDVVRHELGFSKTEKRFPRKDTCVAIYSHRVNTQGALKDTLEGAFPWCVEWEDELKRLFGAYTERKLANQALDYDDLLLYWHAMMEDDALAREIADQFADQLIEVDDYRPGLALNRAVDTARGDTIVIVSAHAIPENDRWLANLTAEVRDPHHLAVYGAQVYPLNARFLDKCDLDIFSDDVSVFTASSPTGPWTYKGRVTTTAFPGLSTYSTFTHSGLPGTSAPVVAFSTNDTTFDSIDQPDTIQVYGPRFVTPSETPLP